MDSITQIVLGAACGEFALGKKIGNKALLFGAIGGTIPDLDVFVGRWLYDNEIQAMAFHRGIMHSIVFALMASIIVGFIAFEAYDNGARKNTTNLKDWMWLFFLAIFTHPLLDCFTPYGTQLFAPFSDYRVAFNTISVADPLYTVPFLLCILIAMFYHRTRTRRVWWVKTGVYLSTLYLTVTVITKLYMDGIFKNSFDKAGISYHRFSAQPTLLNTILWYGVAETETQYYLTFYSMFDNSSTADQFITIDKQHQLLNMKDENLKTLAWFSNGYFNLTEDSQEGIYKYTDLRYPILDPENKDSSVFKFTIIQKNGIWDIVPFEGTPPSKRDFKKFIQRLKGI